MQLSKKAIKEYKEIYKKKTGEDLSDQEVYEQASNLLRAFKAVYRPIPKDKEKEFKRICREQKSYRRRQKR